MVRDREELRGGNEDDFAADRRHRRDHHHQSMTAKQRLKLEVHQQKREKENDDDDDDDDENKNFIRATAKSLNTTNNNSDDENGPAMSVMSKESTKMMEHSKSHPRMLKSNATSHVWALGALAELLDNSQDRECGSTKVEVDAYVLNPSRNKDGYCITVQDDGRGMTRSGLNNMLSFGFSDKEHVSGNVGRFGIGFKSGSMRLADDALILTKREGYAHAALLSQTFLDAVAADDILIPIFSFKIEEVGEVKYVPFEPNDQSEWISNALIFEQYSPFNPTSLAKEFDKIGGPHGTRIILFNLRKRDDTESHLYELDFSVSNDIRIFGHTGENTNKHRGPVFQQHRGGQQATLDVPEDYSLRAYMEVLYLRPRCEFYLRGEKIVPRCPISRLTKEYYVFPEYKPKGFAHGIIVHCGYVEGNSKFCGFHIYNKNRLIRMYQRFASQLQANCMMKDMLGVIEADCVEPTHNKQAFKESALAYHRMKSHVTKCMNEYYFGVQQLRSAGKSGRERIVSHAKGKSALGKKRKTMEQSEDVSVVTLTENETRINMPIYKYKLILQKLMGDRKYSYPFMEKVDPIELNIPDYFDIISHPMDFGTILKNLEPENEEEGVPLDPKKYKYTNESDPEIFANDVRLVFANAFMYNKPGTFVYVCAEKLALIFEGEWMKKFPASSSMYRAGANFEPKRVYEFIEAQKKNEKKESNEREEEEEEEEEENQFDVERVLAEYDDTQKRRWMETRRNENLEMKHKLRNQSVLVVRQQDRIAALEDALKYTKQVVSGVTTSKQDAVQSNDIASRKKLAAEQTVLITQLNAAQEKISEQHAQIEKLRALDRKKLKKAQVRNANRLNQSNEPTPKDIEVDAANIDTKELLQALQSATGKLEKQYTLLQLSRTREARLEVQLRAEKERAKKVQEILNLDSNTFVSEKQVEKVEQPRNKATTTATTNTGQKTREQTTPSKTQSLHVEKIPDFAQPEQSQQLHLPQLPLPPPQPLLSLPPPVLEQSNTVIVTTASDILNQAFEGGSNTPSPEKTACLPTGSDESLQSPMKMVGVQQALHDDDEKHQVQSQSLPTAQYFVKKSGSSTKPKSKRVTIAPPESSLPRGMHSPAKVPRLEKLKQVIMRSPTVVCDKSGAREH